MATMNIPTVTFILLAKMQIHVVVSAMLILGLK